MHNPITLKDVAQLQLGIYGFQPVTWDYYQNGTTDNDVVFGIKRLGDVDVVILRGSATFHDWIRDFDAFALPLTHSKLGPCHPGFLQGMEDAWKCIKANSSNRRVVGGHSLGAGRSGILTGLMILDDEPPLARVAWGEPKPGFPKLSDIVAKVKNFNFRNGCSLHHDLVTDVPLTFPPEEYCHASALTYVNSPPATNDNWGPFAWHHMELYAAAMDQTAVV